MVPKSHSERIAILETQVSTITQTQTAILEKQDKMLTELARYRGAFGFATIVFSAVATALVFFKDALLAKFGLKG